MGPAKVAFNLYQDFKTYRFRKNLYSKIHDFKAHIEFEIDGPRFLVKTVTSAAELLRVFRLRDEVYNQEWKGISSPLGLEVDDFDLDSDHLIIIDKDSWEVIGTYRFRMDSVHDRFYSQDEFELDRFLMDPSPKLELGRACIHKNYRDGITIDLLWRGLARYMTLSKARYVFGCASVMTEDPRVIAGLYTEFSRKDCFSDDYAIRSTEAYNLPGFSLDSRAFLSKEELRNFTPPLLRTYLQAGAKIFGEPAWDREFKCVDILTILDTEQIHPSFKQRFFQKLEAVSC